MPQGTGFKGLRGGVGGEDPTAQLGAPRKGAGRCCPGVTCRAPGGRGEWASCRLPAGVLENMTVPSHGPTLTPACHRSITVQLLPSLCSLVLPSELLGGRRPSLLKQLPVRHLGLGLVRTTHSRDNGATDVI